MLKSKWGFTPPRPEFEISSDLHNEFMKKVHAQQMKCLEQMEDAALAAMCAGVPASRIVFVYPRFNDDMTAIEGRIGFIPL